MVLKLEVAAEIVVLKLEGAAELVVLKLEVVEL